VFITHIGSFKPTVMFFGMTNSPAIFQAMMNEILRNLINKGKVAVFVDDVCKGDRSGRLQEIPQLIVVNEILLQPTSRRFLRELDEASGGNNLHYILQCLHVPALVTRV